MVTKPKNEKAGYKVEGPHSIADLDRMYHHEPQNIHASVAQLLEHRAADGWELCSFSLSQGQWAFIFKANAQ